MNQATRISHEKQTTTPKRLEPHVKTEEHPGAEEGRSDDASRTDGLSLMLRALQFAARKHRDQRRKDNNASPNHPIAFATVLRIEGKVQDPSAIAQVV
jgi:hypothetical protein